jgi:hypothetical protein
LYVKPAYIVSGLISLACPVVAVLKSDHHMWVVKCAIIQNSELE